MLFQSNEWIKTNQKNCFWCKKPWLALWVVFRGNIITYKTPRDEVAQKSANVQWRHQYFRSCRYVEECYFSSSVNIHTLILMCYKKLCYPQACVLTCSCVWRSWWGSPLVVGWRIDVLVSTESCRSFTLFCRVWHTRKYYKWVTLDKRGQNKSAKG